MNVKTLIAAALAAAFAVPLSTLAEDKKVSGAAAGASSDGGAAAMFKSMDKDKDGSISKAEAKGTPHDKDFSTLDKNSDGKLSAKEHAAAPEHAAGGSGASGGTAPKK